MTYKFVLILLLFFTVESRLMSQESTQEEVQRYQDILKKIEMNKRNIKPKMEKKMKAEQHLGIIQRELKFTELQLKQTQEKLTVARKKEKKVSGALVKLSTEFEGSKEKLGKRLSEVYKDKQLGSLEYIFSGKKLIEYADTTYYFDRVMQQDLNMINKIKLQHNQLKTEKQKLAAHQQEIAILEGGIKKKEEQLVNKKKTEAKYISSLESQIEELEQQNEALENESNEIAKFIQQSSRGSSVNYIDGAFVRPVEGWISSRFGYRIHPILKRRVKHNGIDFAAPRGRKIVAANSGRVIVAGQHDRYRGYGKIVVIDHGRQSNGTIISSFYAHQSRVLVTEGERVEKGQVIGWVGSTGFSTGPHLHFEIRVNGQPVDPLAYLRL